jgi:hypothetical protein
MVNWKYPELLDEVLRGIEEDQFEILSSAYAQNVMYATSDWANEQHVVKNREVIEEILNVTPIGFWNPERVWTNKLSKLLVEKDFFYTLIERDILNPEAPETANTVYVHKIDGASLYYLPDNQDALKHIDHAIWTGETEPIIEYLRQLNETETDPVVCYAEDAESVGYWQLAHPTVTSEEVYHNLDKLITTLKEHDWINISLFGDIIAKIPPVETGPLGDGQATWMEESAQRDGYTDYFDYIRTAPEIQYYTEEYDRIEERLRYYESKAGDTHLYQEALMVYLSHQFEFGCATASLGVETMRFLLNVPGKMVLEGARLAPVILQSIDAPKYLLAWRNMGNHPVIVLSNEDVFSIWTPFGGRCVLLIDRQRQTLISPNPYFYNRGNSISDLELPSPTFEFPDYNSSIIHGGTLFGDDLKLDGDDMGMRAVVKREFSAHNTIDKFGVSLQHNYYDTQIIPFDNKIKFWIKFGEFRLLKEVNLLGNEFRVKYFLENPTDRAVLTELGVNNEVSPTPNEIMIGGINILDISMGTNNYSIFNISSGAGVEIKTSVIPSNTEVLEPIFAKRLRLGFFKKVPPHSTVEIDISLMTL